MIVVTANVMEQLTILPDPQTAGHGGQLRTVATKQYQDWQF
jgi:hypothetical protein